MTRDPPGPSQRPSTRKLRGLAVPGGLVHPHIHLDKCFLLDKTPIKDGTFEEAMKMTGKAKEAFTEMDLTARGRRLIRQSLQFGVLAMRCHVEVDTVVGHKCLFTAERLRTEFAQSCDVQLVAFAQEQILYPLDDRKQARMLELMIEACQRDTVAVIGSAPYVEERRNDGTPDNYTAQCDNVRVMFDLAEKFGKELDFHLDYNIDTKTPPLLWFVLEEAHRRSWQRTLTIGHATRISLFKQDELARLQRLCQGLRVAFVALPTSDIYMQGRSAAYGQRIRATMPLLDVAKRDVDVALGVNNVGNLFTPQGDGDPLALLPLVVGLWQAAKSDDVSAILQMVSTSARHVIGLDALVQSPSRHPRVIEVEIDDDDRSVQQLTPASEGCGSTFTLLPGCESVQDAVLAPPAARLTVRNGSLVAWRHVEEGVAV